MTKKRETDPLINAASRISGAAAADLDTKKAEEIVFNEIGQTVPAQDPATLAAQKLAKKSIKKNSKKAQGLEEGRKAYTQEVQKEETERKWYELNSPQKERQKEQLEQLEEQPEQLEKQEVQEEVTKKPAAEQKQQLEKDPFNILMKINSISFLTDYMKSPEDAFLSYGIPGIDKLYKQWSEKHYRHLINETARITNADPEQIRDLKRRTEEQQKVILEIAAKEQLERYDAYFNSNFARALKELEPLKGIYPDPEAENQYTIKQLAALYFFALHFEDIKPNKPDELTEKHLEEIRNIFSKIDQHFYEATDGGKKKRTPKIFIDFLKNTDPEKVAELLPRIMTTPIKVLEYPIDKINSNIWEDLAAISKNADGQIAFATEKRGSTKEATILYSIDFEGLEEIDGLKLPKKLTAFDKRVFIAANASYVMNGQYMSTGQIFTAMGNTGKPSREQLEKINNSLTKMGTARIYLDNSQEVTVNKGYTKFRYDGPLLPFERVSAYINNVFMESAVHLFREAPLMTFAKERKQATSIPKKLLESPISKTEANLCIEDYLLERIARMKSGKGKTNHKILYAKIFEKCQLTTSKQRTRAPEKIQRYLEYYKKCEWIKGYKEESDSIIIEL